MSNNIDNIFLWHNLAVSFAQISKYPPKHQKLHHTHQNCTIHHIQKLSYKEGIGCLHNEQLSRICFKP